jgi:hypothetical protein
LIYNNTILTGKKESVDVLLFSNWEGWATDTSFFNNIFYVEGKGRFSHAIARDADGVHSTENGLGSSVGNVFDHNMYFGTEALSDPHGLNSDPMFESAGHAGAGRKSLEAYAPRKGSPAIDSGKPVEDNGGKDFRGTPVPQCGVPDRGALESKGCAERRHSSHPR